MVLGRFNSLSVASAAAASDAPSVASPVGRRAAAGDGDMTRGMAHGGSPSATAVNASAAAVNASLQTVISHLQDEIGSLQTILHRQTAQAARTEGAASGVSECAICMEVASPAPSPITLTIALALALALALTLTLHLQVMRESAIGSCAHHFCLACLLETCASKPACPKCRTPVREIRADPEVRTHALRGAARPHARDSAPPRETEKSQHHSLL